MSSGAFSRKKKLHVTYGETGALGKAAQFDFPNNLSRIVSLFPESK